MFDPGFLILGLLPILATTAFAWWKGGAPEKWGGLINFASSMVTLAATALLTPDVRLVAFLVADGLLALGFLALALRYASLWLGGAMLFQAVQFSIQAYQMIGASPPRGIYITINNINSAGILLCIITGTIITWRQRVMKRRKAAKEAAAAERKTRAATAPAAPSPLPPWPEAG